MVRINNDYLIECDEVQYILKQDKHKITVEKDGRERPVMDVIGYYATLENALKGYADYMVRKRHAETEFTVYDALIVIREERKKLEELIAKHTGASE